MAGGHSGHSHMHAAGAETGRLRWALALILGLMAVEIGAGVLAHSLALLSDAAHMLTDAAALAMTLLALRLARRPAAGSLTFGLRRAEILSAQANGVALILLGAFIVYGAIGRLISPPHVRGGLVLAVALVGTLVNLAAVSIVSGSRPRSLAVEGSFQHILTDLYAFIATAIAALVIIFSGFERADPIASLVIAALMLRSGLGLVLASGRIFLEAAPEGLDPEVIGAALVAQAGVVEVHDLHVWELTSAFPALSAHVLVARERDCHDARREMERMLRERFGLEHTTLQVDHDSGGLLEIAPRASAPERG
ncbi:MAG TPA: cation diffusion facilitator family transporter [Solirubrobacteraceae bacterium]|nr:cation diffusion facilitator family transporter [Solirubrobacteraceae bacterium]